MIVRMYRVAMGLPMEEFAANDVVWTQRPVDAATGRRSRPLVGYDDAYFAEANWVARRRLSCHLVSWVALLVIHHGQRVLGVGLHPGW